jgi:hypothetical protein
MLSRARRPGPFGCALRPGPASSTYALSMASFELSRRVDKVVDYPPLSEMSNAQRREFQEALFAADCFEDLPGRWQPAVLTAEQDGRSWESFQRVARHACGGAGRGFPRG